MTGTNEAAGRQPPSTVEECDDGVTEPDKPDTGSVWWAELSLGAVCWLSAGGVAMTQTSVGPFSDFRFVYGTISAVLYFVVAMTLGLSFLRSGIQRAPGRDRLR
ncbi:hypothetical protein [Halosimplex amylolyticum]|uniref:hypothetical protein n=1 Tax=Halosimplex amylolyticum TaxID=3396616 RepID=UPI003F56EE2B